MVKRSKLLTIVAKYSFLDVWVSPGYDPPLENSRNQFTVFLQIFARKQ